MIFFDAYFKVLPQHYKDNKIALFHESGDILTITTNINAFVLYADSENIIVKTRLETENIESFIENMPVGVEPFSYEGAEAMGLSNSYIGHTWEEVGEASL